MKLLRNYLKIDKRQERGLFLLLLIFMISIFFNYLAPYITLQSNEYLLDSKIYAQKLAIASFESASNSKSFPKEEKLLLINIDHNIDPNEVSKSDLEKMNLPDHVIKNWMKYLEMGGGFKNKEDVLKIYGMNSPVYEQLEKYIHIKKNNTHHPKVIKNPKPLINEKQIILPTIYGINSADSMQLLEVSGIGPFYAGAIVRYRERLGGFRNLQQLMELYKMDSAKLIKMLPQLCLDSIPIRKLSLNNADFKEILKHPYIDYETTKYIVNKRNKLGKFASLYQLQDPVHFNDSLYQKLLPYIQLDE
jgi:DNA uptake protein ComE-like DNA-binding protein